jgi:hypothetical protein
MVQLLVQRFGPLVATEDDVDRLFLSTRASDYVRVKMILTAGVHPMSPIPALSRDVRQMLPSIEDREVERGRTALHVACSINNLKLAQLLAAFGGEVDAAVAGSDETPEQIAITDYPDTVMGMWAKTA